MGGHKLRSGKKSLRKVLKSVRGVRTWQLFLIFIPLAFLGATLLRFDHIRMTELRAEVIRADDAGDTAVTEQKLAELQSYVLTHIVVNTAESNGTTMVIFGTGPFYLEASYRRAANAAIEAAENSLADDTNPNGNIYEAVRQICQPLAIQNGWQWSDQPYLDCWTTELAKYPTSETLTSNLVSASLPSTELYRRNFASPVWAPTPAGFVLLGSAVLIIIVVVRLLIWLVARVALAVVDKRKAN